MYNNDYHLAIDVGSQSIKGAIQKGSQESLWLGNEPSKSKDFSPNNPNDIDTNAIIKGILSTINKAQNKYGVIAQNIKIIATAGLRNAPKHQQQELIKRVAQETQTRYMHAIDINIIDAHKEAELATKAILSSITPVSNHAIIIDSGGASTEISFINCQNKNFKPIKTTSINIGSYNFNKHTYKQVIKSGISKLGIKDNQQIDVILSGDSAHFLKNKTDKSISDAEGRRKQLFYVKKSIQYFIDLREVAKKQNSNGYEKALIFREIFKNLHLNDYTNILSSLKGIKEGCLLEQINHANITKAAKAKKARELNL